MATLVGTIEETFIDAVDWPILPALAILLEGRNGTLN
jgi:hypothetical protein